jgi:hypothetical protein
LKDLAADLKRASAVLASTGDPGLLRIADGLSVWRDAETITLEMALGLPNTWRSAMRRSFRDDLYAGIARTHFSTLKGLPLARAIVAAIDHYETSSWRDDRANGRRPAGLKGQIFELLSLKERLLDVEALRKLIGAVNAQRFLTTNEQVSRTTPAGIFRAGEYQNQDLGSGEQRENDEHNEIPEGSEIGQPAPDRG